MGRSNRQFHSCDGKDRMAKPWQDRQHAVTVYITDFLSTTVDGIVGLKCSRKLTNYLTKLK